MAVNGRGYMIYGTAAVASPTKSLLSLSSTAAIRPSIYDFYLGSSATPADNALLWKCQRHIGPGTNSPFAAVALDSADPAATATAGYAHSVEPNYVTNAFLFWIALNQRATHRAILDPNRPLTMPAVGSSGASYFVVHSSFTGTVDMTAYYYE